jgi:hypothetical protein
VQRIGAGLGGDDALGGLGILGAAAGGGEVDLGDGIEVGRIEICAPADAVDTGPVVKGTGVIELGSIADDLRAPGAAPSYDLHNHSGFADSAVCSGAEDGGVLSACADRVRTRSSAAPEAHSAAELGHAGSVADHNILWLAETTV